MGNEGEEEIKDLSFWYVWLGGATKRKNWKNERTKKWEPEESIVNENGFMWEGTSVTDDINISSCVGRGHLNGILENEEILEIEKVENSGQKLFFRVWLHRKRIYGIVLKVFSRSRN